MIKFFLFLLMFSLLASCLKKDPSETQTVASDDYVLIEFAARLEEDYHKVESNQKR